MINEVVLEVGMVLIVVGMVLIVGMVLVVEETVLWWKCQSQWCRSLTVRMAKEAENLRM